ncbi:MAG: SNF2-related protein [Ferruginibacter sp.]
MSKFFGKTWWGQQWLNSLTNIDYDNRLPRGSAYARNGSVASISIDENNIRAKVKGSRPKPYDVTVIIPPFFEPEIKKLIKAVAEKPVIVSKLLNRELDPEVLAIAERIGLKVFPKQWTDFKMQCSCPDWAVPCKHLAAVIYKVSAEIDNDPFMVFNLHRVNLAEELKRENIFINSDNNPIPVLQDLLLGETEKVTSTSNKKEKSTKLNKPISLSSPPFNTPAGSLNYATLTPIHEPLVQLLPDAPVFYQGNGNFREKYAICLRKTVRNAQRIVAGKASLDEYFSDMPTKASAKKTTKPSFAINHHTNIRLGLGADNEVSVWLNDIKESVSLNQLIAVLWQIPASQLQNYQPNVAALKNSLLLAINLAANGAIVPQIIRLGNKKFTVRFLPALISKQVKSLVEKLGETLPKGILLFTGKTNTGIEKNALVSLLSIWIDAIVFQLVEDTKGDIFSDLFFSNYTHAFNMPGQQALPGGIQAWLQRYYLTQGNYKPVIRVEELKDEAFLITIDIQSANQPPEEPIALREVITLKKHQQQRFQILQSLSQLSSFIPGLDEYINSKGDTLITMNTNTFTPFLMQAIPAIQLLDITILLPKSLQHILKPKSSVRIKQKAKDGKGFMRLDKLLDFDWQVAIGDTLLNEDEFKKLLKNSDGLIKYKTNYIYVSQGDLEKLHKHFASTKELSAYEMLRIALSNDYYGAGVAITEEVKQIIKELTNQKDIPLPQGINASLRPYQQRGFSWMYRNTKIGFGSVIADDMGLGKTLQVITTLLKYKEEGAFENEKALVIAPTGLLTNWQAEIEKFAPSLRCSLYHGTSREMKKSSDYDVLLTSYGLARGDADQLKKMKWHVVVTDEAQNIKNPETAQSKAIKSIPANTFIAMSGTPVENRLSELWSIMDFSNRGFLGSLTDFRENFATPIQNRNDIAVAEKLKTVTAPFLMRRLKSDKTIISDLPDKIEIDSYSHLAKEQASLYEKTLHKALEAIESMETVDHKSLFVRQGLVLQMILALKQICNHPTQFLKNNVLDASLSGKMELLFDKLESITESGEKVLIFTQFTEMGNLLKHFITERFGETPMFYHGGCNLKQRKEMVDNFQSNPADKIFILSLKAAGTGLNLTAANHVIHYDLWWNPAVEAQATDRAYRIGQKSNVMVHRFITKGTFEERINEMIQSKKALANLTVNTGESWIGNLSNKELKDMFELG